MNLLSYAMGSTVRAKKVSEILIDLNSSSFSLEEKVSKVAEARALIKEEQRLADALLQLNSDEKYVQMHGVFTCLLTARAATIDEVEKRLDLFHPITRAQ
jgi:hypothetical protein